MVLSITSATRLSSSPKKQFIAYAYLAGRIHYHVPKALFGVELAQKEHLDGSPGLFLVAVHTRREHFRVVDYHAVPVVEILYQVFEQTVFYLSAVAVHHHKTCFIAVFGRIFSQQFRRKFKIEIG